MADIFVSYKTEDRARVAPLVAALRASGLDVWWDQDIPVGGGWRDTIAAELDAAALCIVAWSEGSVAPGGRFVREEAERAAARSAYLGVLIDPVMPPFGFAEWQSADLSHWDGKPEGPVLAQFVEQVRARLENRPPPPSVAAPLRKRRRPAWPVALGALLVAVIVALAFVLFGRGGSAEAETPTAFVNARLDATGCSWLEIANVTSTDEGERIALSGIARSPDSVETSIMREAVAASVPVAEIEVDDIAVGPEETCNQLDLLRPYRWRGRPRLRITQPRGSLRSTPQGREISFEFEIDFAGVPRNTILLGLDSTGGIHFPTDDPSDPRSRRLRNVHEYRRQYRGGEIRSNGERVTYRSLMIEDSSDTKNIGLILMSASRPIDEELVGDIGSRSDRDFLTRLNRAAAEGDWKFELELVRCGFDGSITRQRCE